MDSMMPSALEKMDVQQIGASFERDRLTSVFTKFLEQPMNVTAAIAAGWEKSKITFDTESCKPALGIRYSLGSNEPSQDHPFSLYYTAAGQISGVGVDIFNTKEVINDYWRYAGLHQWHITVGFRSKESRTLCDRSLVFREKVGNTFVVNPDYGSWNYTLPMTMREAEQSGDWSRGSCFDSMGWHYFKDLAMGSSMSWDKNNVFPIVPMYHPETGDLQATFFAAPNVQQLVHGNRGWDPIPLPNVFMCKNWCDTQCHFPGVTAWSTGHWFYSDVNTVKCPKELKCFQDGVGCCEA